MKKLAAATLAAFTLCAAVSSPSQFILKHREHNGIGYDTGYTTAEFFLASKWKNNLLPFMDLRGHVFDDGKFATNAGLGLRYNWSDYTIGGNFYYDYREAANLQPHQLSGGLEFLTTQYDIRLNGYGPIADTTANKSAQFIKFQGNSALFKRRLKAALPMIEGEVGMPFGSRCGIANFYGAIGPYYLFQKKLGGSHLGNAVGGEARILLDIIQRFGMQFNFSYDKIFKWVLQGTAGISIPLGNTVRIWKSKSFLCQARNQLPVHREIIPIECKNKRVTSSQRILFVNNTSSSNGTFESPYPTTALAMANSRPGDVIYIFPGDGTTTGYNTALTLLPNQTIQGSGVELDLGDGLVVPAQTFQFPKLSSPNHGVTVGINSTVKGLNITATGNAIRSNDTPNPTGGLNRIEYNFVHNSEKGLFIGNDSNPVNYIVRGNVIRQCSDSGIELNTFGTSPNTVNAVIANNSIQNITGTNLYNTTGNGIFVATQGQSTVGVAILNNSVSTATNGIFHSAVNDAVANVIVKGNHGRKANGDAVIFIENGNDSIATYQIKNNDCGQTVAGNTSILQLTANENSKISSIMTGNKFFDAGTNIAAIVSLEPHDASSLSAHMENNTIFGQGTGILMVNISATNFNLTAHNNILYNLKGLGIDNNATIAVSNSYRYVISNNSFINILKRSIFLSSQTSGVTMDTTIFNNILLSTPANAIQIEGNTGDVCANINGNQAPGQGLQLNQTNPSVFNVLTTTPGSGQGTLDLNDFSGISTTGTVNFVPFGTCP